VLDLLFGSEQIWVPEDTNSDHMIDGADIPFEPGSAKAKLAWKKIEAEALSPENAMKAKELSGLENARGMYKGKVLCPGVGKGQSDFEFLVDKLHYYNGHSASTASKIAGSVRWSKG
jgi:hypothetical protein